MNCLENGPPPIEKGYGIVSIKSVSVSVSVSLYRGSGDSAVKDPRHSAKSAGGRLQLNTYGPYVSGFA